MKRLWTSNMRNKLKIRAFKATVETVILYGSQCWILDSKLRKLIDGCYTRLLSIYTYVYIYIYIYIWFRISPGKVKQARTNQTIWINGSSKATDIISDRMLNLAGHCIRNKEEMTHGHYAYNILTTSSSFSSCGYP